MARILIVDDDRNIADGLAQLVTLEGYEAIVAYDGQTGFDQFQSNDVDLLILDIMMPHVDGYELCKRIRTLDTLVPVIMLSAKSEEIDKVVGLEIGADDFVSKPFGSREIIARIRARLRKSTPSSKDQSFSLSDLMVDSTSYRACRTDQVIELTSRDVKVLRLFYEKQGQVLSRDDIYDCGWGRHLVFNSRVVDQYISQLRKRIEINSQQPQIIKTVHAIGYRYEAF